MLFVLLALLLLLAGFARWRIALRTWLFIACAAFIATAFVGDVGLVLSLLLLAVLAATIALLYYAPGARKKIISAPLLAKLRESECRAAAQPADGGWVSELFGGDPDWTKLFNPQSPADSNASSGELTRITAAVDEVRAEVDAALLRAQNDAEANPALARIGGGLYLLQAAQSLLQANAESPVLTALTTRQCAARAHRALAEVAALRMQNDGVVPHAAVRELLANIPQGGEVFARALQYCHPHLHEELAVLSQDYLGDEEALTQFDAALCRHIIHAAENKIRVTAYALSRGRLARGDGDGLTKQHCRSVAHLSAAFAFLTDMHLLFAGAAPPQKMLATHFADALGNLLLASAALKVFRDRGMPPAEAAIADWACRDALHRAQQGLDAVLRNFPRPVAGFLLRFNAFGGGRYLHWPDDALTLAAAEAVRKRASFEAETHDSGTAEE